VVTHPSTIPTSVCASVFYAITLIQMQNVHTETLMLSFLHKEMMSFMLLIIVSFDFISKLKTNTINDCAIMNF